jgi:hypothetical protein
MFPDAIRNRWPEIQRIRLSEVEWTHLPPDELAAKASALRQQIIGLFMPPRRQFRMSLDNLGLTER